MSASLFSLCTYAVALAAVLSAHAPVLPPQAGAPEAPGTSAIGWDSLTARIGEAAREAAVVRAVHPTAADVPVRVFIPSISLDSPVVSVGVNAKGEMDVPDGATNEVGWYKGGTVPGFRGSAVFDAHVYAAFADLRYVKIGQEIFVTTADGRTLRFVVRDSRVYELGELPPELLFGQDDAKRLNLITCAGTYDGSLGTYAERLVIYATLTEEMP